jgi:hypothetical protein
MSFAIWRVGERTATQLLMCDRLRADAILVWSCAAERWEHVATVWFGGSVHERAPNGDDGARNVVPAAVEVPCGVLAGVVARGEAGSDEKLEGCLNEILALFNWLRPYPSSSLQWRIEVPAPPP